VILVITIAPRPDAPALPSSPYIRILVPVYLYNSARLKKFPGGIFTVKYPFGGNLPVKIIRDDFSGKIPPVGGLLIRPITKNLSPI